jgi:hypothetical protein
MVGADVIKAQVPFEKLAIHFYYSERRQHFSFSSLAKK